MREKFQKREKPEFEQRLVDIARVTRVMAGGKRLRFRACVVIGDLNGRVGWGIAKGADVSIAINKAVSKAKKQMITVNTYKNTIAHEVKKKFKSAFIYLKPAPEGRGVIAGGVVRDVMELAGIKDIIAKMYGSNSKINNVRATFEALSDLRLLEEKKSDSKEKVLEKSESILVEDIKKEE
ncbi:MAG: 30S ribosomal protein S5 [Patescibacteria group bacterium]|nr:30S ribosomal protein S5 [Patescibacteria group bacterium]MDD4304625.1 30S ribosomal protein S5 [Patescibacteria group bacterium]MDD4695552.1 30S ribosomal protein S5 [Patescibacteria group bacterium]